MIELNSENMEQSKDIIIWGLFFYYIMMDCAECCLLLEKGDISDMQKVRPP